MTDFATSRPLPGGATNSVAVLAKSATADGDLTLLQIVQHSAAQGLLPAAGTPLDSSLDALAEATQAAQTKADNAVPAITASPVVPNGIALSRTATAGAATGHYNRPLHISENKVLSTVGAVDGDQVYAFNTSTSPVSVTAGGVVVVTIPAKSWGELTRAGGALYDTSATAGTPSSYTDAQARAAAVLTGALGNSTTQAPTHAAVADAIAGAGGYVALPSVTIDKDDVPSTGTVYSGLTLSKALHFGTAGADRIIYFAGGAAGPTETRKLTIPTAAECIAAGTPLADGDSVTVHQVGETMAVVTFAQPSVQAVGSTSYMQTSGAGTVVQFRYRAADGKWLSRTSALHTSSAGNSNPVAVWTHEGLGQPYVNSYSQSCATYIGGHWLQSYGSNSGVGDVAAHILVGGVSTQPPTTPPNNGFRYSTVRVTAEVQTYGGGWQNIVMGTIACSKHYAGSLIPGTPTGHASALLIEGDQPAYIGSINGTGAGAWAAWTAPTSAGRGLSFVTGLGISGEHKDTSANVSFQIPEKKSKVIITGSGSKVVTFPALPFDGQLLLICVRTAHTGITLDGAGKTVVGQLGATAGSSGQWSYCAADNTWDKVA